MTVVSPRLPYFSCGSIIARDIRTVNILSLTYISPSEVVCFEHVSRNVWYDASNDAFVHNTYVKAFLNTHGTRRGFKEAYVELKVNDVYLKNPRLVPRIPRIFVYKITYLSKYKDCISNYQFINSLCKISLFPLSDDRPLKSVKDLFKPHTT